MLMKLSSTAEELSQQPKIILLLVPEAMNSDASCCVRVHILTGRKRAAPSHPPHLLYYWRFLLCWQAAVSIDGPHIRK